MLNSGELTPLGSRGLPFRWHDNFGIARKVRPAKISSEMALASDVFNQARGRANHGDDEGALAGFASVVERMREVTGSRAAKLAGTALYNMGNAMARLGRGDNAIRAYDDAAARVSRWTNRNAQFLVAVALVNRGIQLRELGRPELAIDVLLRVVALYSGYVQAAF